MVQSLDTAIAADVTAGQAVATVTDLSTVWMVAQIRPQEASMLAVGNQMTARPSGNGDATPVVARISTIDGMADPATGLLWVVSVVDNASGALRPGEMLDVRIETTRSVSGLIVPTIAIQTIDGHSVVYTLHGNEEFHPHEVRVLLATEDEAVIAGDLKPGDRVVSSGSFSLKGTALLSDADDD